MSREISVKSDKEFAEYLASAAEELMMMLQQYVKKHPNGELAALTRGTGTIITASLNVSMQQDENNDLTTPVVPTTYDFNVGAHRARKHLQGFKWRESSWVAKTCLDDQELEFELLNDEGEPK